MSFEKHPSGQATLAFAAETKLLVYNVVYDGDDDVDYGDVVICDICDRSWQG